MKRALLLFVLLTASAISDAAVISIKFINTPDKLRKFSVYAAIDGYSNLFYPAVNITKTDTNSYELNLPDQKKGFVYVMFYGTKLNLYCKAQDSISVSIEFGFDQASHRDYAKNIELTGGETEANIILNQLTNTYFNSGFLVKRFFISPAFRAREISTHLKLYIDSLCRPLDMAFTNKAVSNDCYVYIRSLIEGNVLSSFVNEINNAVLLPASLLAHASDNTEKDLLKSNIEALSAQSKKIKEDIYKEYNPLHRAYQYTFLGIFYVSDYFRDGASETGHDISHNTFDQIFTDEPYLKTIESTFAVPIVFDKLRSLLFNSPSDKRITIGINMFRELYPASSFNAYLQRERSIVEKDNEIGPVEKKDSGIKHLNVSNTDLSLKKLHQRLFRGKRVFVDLWASWCIPCIQEMRFAHDLKSLLDSHNIELLYLSLDDKSAEIKKNKLISELNLSGYHYTAGPALVSGITKQVYKSKYFSIPRYILLSDKGEIINDNMPRPSDLNALKKAIDVLMNK